MIEAFLIMTSIHLDNSYDYNERNIGIALRHDHLVAGIYDNSFNETSVFLGGDKHWNKGDLEYGFIAGGVTGYDMDWTVGGVTAFVAPYVSYDIKGVKPTVLLLGNAVTFSVGFEF